MYTSHLGEHVLGEHDEQAGLAARTIADNYELTTQRGSHRAVEGVS